MICPDARDGKCNSTDCPHHEWHLESAACHQKQGPDCPNCVYEVYKNTTGAPAMRDTRRVNGKLNTVQS